MKRYNPSDIESKWQEHWDKNQTYKADHASNKPKYIAMSMFNYPSGAGIHIGHAMNYTISDVMARFKRQQGYESYHPVGWDAFGLPAENYAIKAGVSPQASMAKIIPDYHAQYKAMGWSNDWSKEIATHEPGYYKWTQWIFTQMHKNGLAYQDNRMQWWCEKDNTVLANEQVIDGKCWRHDGPDDPLVEKREIKQWFFKITEYADELLEATEDLDWTESVKMAQKNWIGKSKGAEIDFAVDGTDHKITVFTTRPDTLCGATFLVLAPENELVLEITSADQLDSVKVYQKVAAKKTEVERQASKDKTGVFTGAYAVNPINNDKMPIWIADYVLSGYGTGAIMAVPAHDERDQEFAHTYNLPIIGVVEPSTATSLSTESSTVFTDEGVLMNSGSYDGMPSSEAREKIVADLAAKGIATEVTNYKLRDWSVGRQRYWGAPIPIINCEKCGQVLVPDDQLPVVLPELEDFQPKGDGRSALARATDWLKVQCPQCGGDAERETDTLDTYICSSWYMLRYLDPHNTEAPFSTEVANKWMPIDFYNGGDHATAHMMYARFVTRFFHKLGLVDNPEPFKKFLFNGKITAADGEMFSKSKGNGIDPLEIINQGYGADALRTYLMFAAPLDLWIRWDKQGVPGTFRFLNRVWNLVQEFVEAPASESGDESILRAIHPAIKKVTADIEEQKYNTAIATMMKVTNDLYVIKGKSAVLQNTHWRFALESLVMLIAPFAPHTAEQLWQDLGHNDSVNRDHWPAWDNQYLVSDTITIVVQVNGKLRAQLQFDSNTSREEIIAAARNDERVAQYVTTEPKKTIYVEGKLISFVV